MVLNGKKTYITATVTVIYAVSAAWLGHIDWNSAIALVLGAVGIGFGLGHKLDKLSK